MSLLLSNWTKKGKKMLALLSYSACKWAIEYHEIFSKCSYSLEMSGHIKYFIWCRGDQPCVIHTVTNKKSDQMVPMCLKNCRGITWRRRVSLSKFWETWCIQMWGQWYVAVAEFMQIIQYQDWNTWLNSQMAL